MKIRERKADYVQLQMKHNMTHLDGRLENETDWQLADEVSNRIKLLDPNATDFLVLGCRTGHELTALQMLRPDAFVVGIDIVPEFVKLTQERTGALAVVADMQDLSGVLDDKGFDWVICIGTLEHAHDPGAAAREMLRVANRGIYVTADLEEFSEKNQSHHSYSTDPAEWLALFKSPDWAETHEIRESTLHITLRSL